MMAESNFADKTIWTGDNLDILRGMNNECVDLVYLDPPFNSNQDYAAPVGGAAFKDTWTLSDLDVAWMGLIADEQAALAHVIKTSGMTHGKGMQSYLTMVAVRLMEMHRVLKPTGSCDPTASHYLKLVRDAVFGRETSGTKWSGNVLRATLTPNDLAEFTIFSFLLVDRGRPGTGSTRNMTPTTWRERIATRMKSVVGRRLT